MNQKQKWTTMALLMGLTLLWVQVLMPALYKHYNWKMPGEKDPTPAVVDNSTPASGPATTSTTASTAPSTNPVLQPAPPPVASAAASEIVIGSTEYDPDQKKPNSPYPLGVKLNSRGAAIESVTLNRYRQQYDKPNPYVFQTPYPDQTPFAASLATRWVSIAGVGQQSLDAVNWAEVPRPAGESGTRKSAGFSVDLNDAFGKPQVRILKTYEIREAADKSAGYEMLVKYDLQNLTDKPLKARLAFNGTTAPKSENSRDVPEVVAGFDTGGKSISVPHAPVSSVTAETPLDIHKLGDSLLLWTGVSSAYFDAIVRPVDSSGKTLVLTPAKVVLLNPAEKDSLKHNTAFDLETGDLDLPAAGSSGFVLNVYVGPKLREVLNNSYYSEYPMDYHQTLVLVSRTGIGWICGLCTWTPVINLLVTLLQWFHAVFHDWGLSIIALVCVVRLILHPITKRSQVSMSRMTKMGPEMERLKAKHKDDPDALKKAQMEFYREQGIAPMLGCLPMFLQTPIWIALWSSLQSTFEIRHARFLSFGNWHLTWIGDLSQPDRLFPFSKTFDFFFLHMDAINILPILMAGMFYLQQQFQPKPVAATPEQEQQQKMMKWMSIFMFPIFLYSQPSGLNLYIFTSTLIGIFESKRIRDHIKEKEEREKQGVVIVDAEPGKRTDLSPGQAKRAKPAAEPDKPVGWLARKMEELKRMAEEAQKEAQKQGKKKKP